VSAVRFSIQIPSADDLGSWQEKLRRAEDLGFYSVSIPDHLGPSLPQMAPLVGLAAAAAVTERLRLASTVLDNDFRHPVMVAKEIATLDRLSGGRVDFGLGAGWLEEDYTTTGIASWDPPGARVDRLCESISLIRRLFTGEAVDFDGEHYTVKGFVAFPTPLQAPVPLMIGARSRRMLSIAAREAQVVSVLAQAVAGGNQRAGFEQQLRWIEEAGGRQRDDLVVGLRIPFGQIAAPGASGLELVQQWASRLGLPADEVRSSPFMIVGDLAMVRDHLGALAERDGIGYVTLSEELAWSMAPVVAELSS